MPVVFTPALLLALVAASVCLALVTRRLQRGRALGVPTVASAIFIALSWLVAMAAIIAKIR